MVRYATFKPKEYEVMLVNRARKFPNLKYLYQLQR